MNQKLLSLCLVVPFLFCCNSSDKKAWEKAQAKASISSFESYLLEYPNGSMNDEAKARIEELYFKEAEQLNSITAFDNFVMRYPHGRWSDKARIETETLRFKKAQIINAIPAYQDFIDRYPEGPMSDIAKQKREELFNNRHPDFKGTKTARILIDESFAISFSSKYQNTYSRIKKIAEKLCEMAGLQVVGANDDNYDITLRIQLRWTPLSAQYAPKGGNRLFSSTIYSGARVQGVVSLINPQNVVHKKNIEGLLSPPEETMWGGSDPSEAPLVETLDKYVEPKMIELMRDDYGLDPLSLANTPIVSSGIVASILKERGESAIETWIENVDYNDDSARNRAELIFSGLSWIPTKLEHRLRYLSFYHDWKSIVEIGKPAVSFLITIMMENSDPLSRSDAARALGEIKDTLALPVLIRALNDDSDNMSAVWALGEFGTSDALETLIRNFEKNIKVEKDAVKQERETGTIVDRAHMSLSGNYMETILKIGNFRAIEYLIGMMNNEKYSDLQTEITMAFERMNWDNAPLTPWPGEWNKWWRKNKNRFNRE